MPVWLNNGGIVVTDGKIIICNDCPCCVNCLPCCIPKTIHGTITNDFTGACVAWIGVVGAFVHNAVSGSWYGSFVLGGDTMYGRLDCFDLGGGDHTLHLFLHATDPDVPLVGSAEYALERVSCDPILFRLAGYPVCAAWNAYCVDCMAIEFTI